MPAHSPSHLRYGRGTAESKAGWQGSSQADGQIRTEPQASTFGEKTQSKRTPRCPTDAWDVTSGKDSPSALGNRQHYS